MFAKAWPAARPAITKYSIDSVGSDDLVIHLRHEFEVHGAESAGDPQLRVGPVKPLITLRIDGDPIGVSLIQRWMSGVWISASHDIHAEFAAALHEIAKRIAIAEELTPIV